MIVGRTAKARTASGLPGVPSGPKTSESRRRSGREVGDDGGDACEDAVAEAPLDDEEGEENLQAESPRLRCAT